MDWGYMRIMNSMIRWYFDQDCIFMLLSSVFLALALLIWVFVYGPFCFLFYSIYLCAVYWWALLELYPFAILDSFLFIDFDSMSANAYYEMASTKREIDVTTVNKWKLTWDYLKHIDDSINYKDRLCIIQYLIYIH